MKKTKLKTSKAQTIYIKKRGIPRGCQLCLKGAKTVLFINGLCQNPTHCWWYCPISEERKGKEVSYADELQINSKEDLIKEIDTIGAKGISITGGDPLFPANVEKTIDWILFLKKEKGKGFHIHLYTNGENFTEDLAENLSQAGLDEIRFNPSESNWHLISLALDKGMSVGVEMPVIPDANYLRTLENLIYYLDKIGADFINLNEFEYCFPNSQQLKNRGFYLKEGTMATVENSQEEAIKLIERIAPKVKIKMHYCPIIAKDFWQLKERYHRRALNIKLPYEHINDEGLLMFGQIEGSKNDLKQFFDFLQQNYKIPRNDLELTKCFIRLPITIALKEDFQDNLSKYRLTGFIIEMTPFRETEYCQITEKIPIDVFREEYEVNVG